LHIKSYGNGIGGGGIPAFGLEPKVAGQISPEMPFGKCMAGTGFEIFFKRIGPVGIGESNSNRYFPGPVFAGMWRFASVMV